MKKVITSEIVINKSKKEVWNFITDFYTYHEWSTYFLGIRSKEIDINKVGQKVRGFFVSEKLGPLMYNAIITEYDAEKVVSWKGKIIMPFGCHGKHSFLLEEIDENTTKLIVKKEFSGFTVGLMKQRYFERLQEGFDSLCTSAKERIENPEKFVKTTEEEKEDNVHLDSSNNTDCDCHSDHEKEHKCNCESCDCDSTDDKN